MPYELHHNEMEIWHAAKKVVYLRFPIQVNCGKNATLPLLLSLAFLPL
jgi:hypothetical protein